MCDVAESDQQIHEGIHSILLKKPELMYDSYPFKGSVGEEDQLVDSHNCIVVYVVQEILE